MTATLTSPAPVRERTAPPVLTQGRLPRWVPWALLGASWVVVGLVYALLAASGATGGFDTGLNPRHEMGKEQEPLVAPPASVVRGTAR